MRRRFTCLVFCVSALGAAPAVSSAAAGAGPRWKPVGLARTVVAANLKKAVPRSPAFVGGATCTGRTTVAHCAVDASVSSDDVSARVKFTRHRDGSHVRYVDRLTFVDATGATVTRTFYGRILTS